MPNNRHNRCPNTVAAACAGILLLLAPVVALAAEGQKADVGTLAKEFAYDVDFEGPVDKDLLVLLKSVSRLVMLTDEPPLSISGLRRRTTKDMERLGTALRSEGYYSATTKYRLDSTKRPVKIVVEIDPGPAYRLKAYNVVYKANGRPEADLPNHAGDLQIELDARARAPEVVQHETSLIEKLAELGYPFALALDREVIVDHSDASVAVAVTVDLGLPARFGVVIFSGLITVEEPYLRRFISWQRGDRFDQARLNRFRAALSNTNLFRSVKVTLADSVDTMGELPLSVSVSETPHRSVGVGARYSSSEGFGGELFWEHRNFFGAGEELDVSAEPSQIRQKIVADLRKPNFLVLDQTLRLNLTAKRQDTEAFKELAASAAAAIDRRLGRHGRLSLGITTEVTEVKDTDQVRTFLLTGLPASVAWDTTDDVLDPTRGTRSRIALTPFNDTLDVNTQFLVSEISGSAYYPIYRDRAVFAIRGKLGSIVGTSLENIPASKRLFAGGGGSIRGYDFQFVGPLDTEGDPVGGRSVSEVGAELRLKLTDRIGMTGFMEGGNVFRNDVPDFSRKLLWAAGFGGRYYTVVGPIRVDFAFPVNGRKGVDDAFEFYISLGQAF